MAYIVYIGDPAGEVTAKLDSALQEREIMTRVFPSFSALEEGARRNLPDLILMNPTIMKNGDAESDLFRRVPTIAYGAALSGTDQQALYQRGLHRVVNGDGEPESLIPISERILERRSQLRARRRQALTSGTVQSFSIAELLQNALLEEKNLILKVRNRNWEVKLRTYQGHVVSAFSPHLANEDAVIKTLLQASGDFVIRGYSKAREVSPISTSTLALLAEARFQKNAIEAFLKKTTGEVGNPSFSIAMMPNPKALTPAHLKVLATLKENPGFRDVMTRSPLPVRTSLRTLEELLDAGIINLESGSEAVADFESEDLSFVGDFFPENSQQGSLAIIGGPGTGRSELIRTMAGQRRGAIKSVQSFDLTRIALSDGRQLTIFGMPTEESFFPMLEKIESGLIGCVFMMDYSQPDQFEFNNYLFAKLTQLFQVPFVIALVNSGGDGGTATVAFRKAFNVPGNIRVIPVEVNRFAGMRELLSVLALENGEEEDL